MSKGFRIFEAPFNQEESLPIEPSPWFIGRDAQIPLGHWELLIEFAREVDPQKASQLEASSVGAFDNDNYIDLSVSEMTAMIEFMLEVKRQLGTSKSILSLKNRVFNDIYDEYNNAEYQRMLAAVIAAYRESQRLGEPVCAYNS